MCRNVKCERHSRHLNDKPCKFSASGIVTKREGARDNYPLNFGLLRNFLPGGFFSLKKYKIQGRNVHFRKLAAKK